MKFFDASKSLILTVFGACENFQFSRQQIEDLQAPKIEDFQVEYNYSPPVISSNFAICSSAESTAIW